MEEVSPDLLGESTADMSTVPGAAPRPPLVGERYLLLDPLAKGGSAIVYAAYDRKLDRKIAIKVLNGDLGARAQGSLAREAQALAHLRHPNVVTVHDTGVIGAQVFIAMELVEGTTLHRWLRAAPRPWRQVVRVFLDAGRGLAAAHAVGLVHRDFKPDNVLIGDDGSVRVADFGLAHRLREPQTGAVVGTPRYMAPEQRAGAAVDARADQYAFGVALAAALEGRRGVPRRAFAVVRRGLREDAAARYPSMTAMLDELAAVLLLARRRAAVAVLAAATAGIAALAVTRPPAADPPCVHAGDGLAGAWDDAVRARVRGAFIGTALPWAADTLDRVTARLDGYAAGWVAMRREACEATRVRHEQSDALLDLRMECLDRRRGALAGLTAVLGQGPDPRILGGAVAAVAGLDELAACADRAALSAAIPPPPKELALRVSALRARIDAAEALHRLAEYPRGLVLAQAAVADAREVPYLPVQAAALAALFKLQSGARDFVDGPRTGAEALLLAARARDDAGAAGLWLHLVFLVSEGERPADARALFPGAEAAVARAGDDTGLRARLLYVEGITLRKSGEPALAQLRHEEAVRLLEGTPGRDERSLASNLKVLGQTLLEQGKLAAARDVNERAVAIMGRLVGAHSPAIGSYLLHLGNVYERMGRPAEARRLYARALAVVELSEPEGSTVWTLEYNLGLVALAEERHDEAEARFTRALALGGRRLAPEHPILADSVRNIAQARAAAGRPAEAVEPALRAVSLGRAAMPAARDRLGDALGTLASVRLAQGAASEALAAVEEAIAMGGRAPLRAADLLAVRAEIHAARGRRELALADEERVLEAHRGEGGVFEAASLTALGARLVDLGRAAEAAPLLERAVVLQEDAGAGPSARAQARFALARARWERGDRVTALRLAGDAGARYAALGPRHTRDRAAVARWQAEREKPVGEHAAR